MNNGKDRLSGQRSRRRMMVVCLSFLWTVALAHAESFTILTPFGPVDVDLPHVDPGGSLVAPIAPSSPEFRPPSIFSAPLPSGSGARALGLAGAFTAVADDATAASWNPAGLIQLEVPEASFMLRVSHETQEHLSLSEDFVVGENDFGNMALNYLSAVVPFRLMDRNFVFSANYQEAYDFKQEFTADLHDTSASTSSSTDSGVYSDTITDHYVDSDIEIDLTSYLTTRKNSSIRQVLNSDVLTALNFEQEGIIDAVTPSLAVEITPKLYAGLSLNHYQDSLFGEKIRSRTEASYNGNSTSSATVTDDRETSGTYEFTGVFHPPWGGPDVPFGPDGGAYPDFGDTSTATLTDRIEIEGTFEEVNEFEDLHGINATLGMLWTLNRYVSVGASVDLPWTAEAEQKKSVKNTVTTFSDSAHTKVLDVSSSEEVTTKDVEFDFPLYWAVGMVLRANNRLYASLDVSQTQWSEFSFKAEGEERINPLDGTPHGQNEVDDTWSVRGGVEYLVVLKNTEVPMRGGVAWEQRPAIGTPDEFWNFSLGSGVSIGKGSNRIIIDLAYILTYGDDVLGSLVPGQKLTTDVVEHQGFLSCIKHF